MPTATEKNNNNKCPGVRRYNSQINIKGLQSQDGNGPDNTCFFQWNLLAYVDYKDAL